MSSKRTVPERKGLRTKDSLWSNKEEHPDCHRLNHGTASKGILGKMSSQAWGEVTWPCRADEWVNHTLNKTLLQWQVATGAPTLPNGKERRKSESWVASETKKGMFPSSFLRPQTQSIHRARQHQWVLIGSQCFYLIAHCCSTLLQNTTRAGSFYSKEAVQHGGEKHTSSRTQVPEFESYLLYLLAVWTWTSYLLSLYLSFHPLENKDKKSVLIPMLHRVVIHKY